jgi:UDP-N-acetylmuramate dehydrogenase
MLDGFKTNVSLSKNSWLAVGGQAECFFKPRDIESLSAFLRQNKTPVTILGNCSNVIIRDGGISGTVIKLGSGFSGIKRLSGTQIEVGAAMLDLTLSQYALQMELSGFEFLSTIPGAVGGGIKMNAGCFGSEVAEVLVSFKAIDGKGKIHEFRKSEINFSYRKSLIDSELIIISAVLEGSQGNAKAISYLMERNSIKRSESQPTTGKTCGSTFKNPSPHDKAWKLIYDAGLSGFSVGGAFVSPKHANFIINDGSATAADIEILGETIRLAVKEKYGILLEWEIERIGNFPNGMQINVSTDSYKRL